SSAAKGRQLDPAGAFRDSLRETLIQRLLREETLIVRSSGFGRRGIYVLKGFLIPFEGSGVLALKIVDITDVIEKRDFSSLIPSSPVRGQCSLITLQCCGIVT